MLANTEKKKSPRRQTKHTVVKHKKQQTADCVLSDRNEGNNTHRTPGTI
jgi:hypothetical protein